MENFPSINNVILAKKGDLSQITKWILKVRESEKQTLRSKVAAML